MSVERDVIRKLVFMCITYELNVQVAYRLLQAIAPMVPQIHIQEEIDETHRDPQLKKAAEEKYQMILDMLDSRDLTELLAKLPETKYKN